MLGLVLITGFGLSTIGVRSWIHWRRTGTTGIVVDSRSTRERVLGAAFVASILVAAAATVLDATGTIGRIAVLDRLALTIAGTILFVAGWAGTLWAQFGMGESWRVGVDHETRTELVTGGPFRWVRNPIFTAML